jgi:hypothetical protein
VLKAEIAAADPMKLLLNEYLSTPSWRTWPPAWWPHDRHDAGAGNSEPPGDELNARWALAAKLLTEERVPMVGQAFRQSRLPTKA